MTLYTIKWAETHHHEIDIAADSRDQAEAEFWTLYHAAAGNEFWADSTVSIDGPEDSHDIGITWRQAVVDINVTGGQT